MMRDEDSFIEPNSFLPERFLTDSQQQNFLPFLTGPDMCIGHKFAMLEMKLILANLFHTSRFGVPEGAEFKGCQGLTYHLTPPLYLNTQPVTLV